MAKPNRRVTMKALKGAHSDVRFELDPAVPLGDLHQDPRNARVHGARNMDAIKASLKAHGQVEPLVVQRSSGRIIGGNARYQAMEEMGWVTCAVAYVDDDAAAATALGIRLNKTAELAAWDEDVLGEIGGELNLADMGFDEDDLARLLAPFDEACSDNDSSAPIDAQEAPNVGSGILDVEALQESEIPEAPARPVSKRGDIWQLGSHRLMCGDSTDADDVAALMDGERASLVFTSPPYAQQRDYGAKIDDWDALMRGVFGSLSAATKPDAQVLVNLGLIHKDGEVDAYWEKWVSWMRQRGWRHHGWYVWDKMSGMPGSGGGRPASCHEWIFHFNMQARTPNKTVACKFAGQSSYRQNPRVMASSGGPGVNCSFANPDAVTGESKIPDSVFRTPAARTTGKVEASHPAVFPVALVAMVMAAYSGSGDASYEPFAGSGTSIIAAEQIGRRCFAMDVEPSYVDIAVRRWESLTGKKAQRLQKAA